MIIIVVTIVIIVNTEWGGESLTEIQGCLSASAAVIRLDGLMVNILLMRSLASGVTVSHSGEGNYRKKGEDCPLTI